MIVRRHLIKMSFFYNTGQGWLIIIRNKEIAKEGVCPHGDGT
ncbi:hypothetical protein EV210_12625 [Anaerospora hongkongensis]|uniref:Uncharacterized protein n=1 Tax=Anaerospora hongkongensis TaxID=244830 RepID=A0A4R1PVV0_9FIRM|nr:hypothetical protein EV210_12625 [Anaerospora hongkongensis]